MTRRDQITRLTSIVAIDENGAIGCKNALPWSLKSDMAFFRRETLGNTVIMGRKTYDSIGKPLAGRMNVVLSHNNVLFQDSAHCRLALSVREALFQTSTSGNSEAYVIGGAVTYDQFASFVDRYLVTVVSHQANDADAFLGSGIISDLAKWQRELIASYPIDEGRDQYAFEIFEITPPDVSQRLEKRELEIGAYEARLSRPAAKTRAANPRNLGSQEAFAF
jgi:dihydrofolate reductase